MAKLVSLVFRELTPADYFNINKPRGTEEKGGGQSYIDFPVGQVSLAQWRRFLSGYTPEGQKSGPLWRVQLNSLGGLGVQRIDIGQRRPASVSIRAQKLHSARSNRVLAWHPDHGAFPRSPDNVMSAQDSRITGLLDGLRVFILRGRAGDLWAGWLRQDSIQALTVADGRFSPMAKESAGYIVFEPPSDFDHTSLTDPFGLRQSRRNSAPSIYHHLPTDGRQDADVAQTLDLLQGDFKSEKARKEPKTVAVFERNKAAVKKLKALYGKCQITGETYVFRTTRGRPYLEAHHLIPLGEGGSDRPANIVVVSAHVHRMLHHADVQGIDLRNMSANKLKITINGVDFTITWHPEHAKVVHKG